MRGFLMALVVAFILASAPADRGATTVREIDVTVVDVQPREWMLVTDELLGLRMRVAVTDGTTTEGRSSIRHVTTNLRFRRMIV